MSMLDEMKDEDIFPGACSNMARRRREVIFELGKVFRFAGFRKIVFIKKNVNMSELLRRKLQFVYDKSF